ncbi:hypothetical protein DY000_02006364 [Brassica cretica]|uniref:Uncharacterized protein n=1 Tax=Brassica cretica TaxID=69181 RepID=A0ABQ7BY82_BRACR|nr:hypothetical protein DY000_02006364 [Brassica cretica]
MRRVHATWQELIGGDFLYDDDAGAFLHLIDGGLSPPRAQMDPAEERREMKRQKEHYIMLQCATGTQYGIPTRCLCGSRIINEVRGKEEYDTLPGKLFHQQELRGGDREADKAGTGSRPHCQGSCPREALLRLKTEDGYPEATYLDPDTNCTTDPDTLNFVNIRIRSTPRPNNFRAFFFRLTAPKAILIEDTIEQKRISELEAKLTRPTELLNQEEEKNMSLEMRKTQTSVATTSGTTIFVRAKSKSIEAPVKEQPESSSNIQMVKSMGPVKKSVTLKRICNSCGH